MSYELFQQGPAVYVPVILVSLVITVVAYGAIPFIIARTCKKVISKKKYNMICYGCNLLIMMFFIAINGVSSGAPYFLWTWVFTQNGCKKLASRGFLEGSQGINIEENTKQSENQNIAAGSPAIKVASPPTTNPTAAPKRKNKHAAVVALAVLLFVSLVFNAYQFGVNIQNQKNVTTLDEQLIDAKKTILNKTKTIAKLEEEVSEQKSKISSMEFGNRSYNGIIQNMRFGNAGYAANNFYATDSVIVVSQNETDRKFRLYASWSNGGTVEVDYSSSCAWVSFDDDEWYSWTDMTVHPSTKGVTVATFSNSVNSDTFKVLIIVTD